MSVDKRVLSIQSTVVFGYVGNKSGAFPLQLHGYDVSTINSVQFSNHTGYGKWKGQVLNANEAADLFEGLRMNNLLGFNHVLTGYIGSDSFLKKVGEAVKEMKAKNPNLIYLCDPVMGDNGKLYVSETLVPLYQNDIVELADIIVCNQFELGLLTKHPVTTEEEAFTAIGKLHDRGVSTVVLSSCNIGPSKEQMLCLASYKKGGVSKRFCIKCPYMNAIFVGTGDLFAASLLVWLDKDRDLKSALEKTVSVVQKVIKRTYDHAKSLAGEKVPTMEQMELRLVQSKSDIENPQVIFHAEEI